jgi:hypothetical protein
MWFHSQGKTFTGEEMKAAHFWISIVKINLIMNTVMINISTAVMTSNIKPNVIKAFSLTTAKLVTCINPV